MRSFWRACKTWFGPVAGAAYGSLNQKERQRVLITYLVTHCGATVAGASAGDTDVTNLVVVPTLLAACAAALEASARYFHDEPRPPPLPPCPTESSSSRPGSTPGS